MQPHNRVFRNVGIHKAGRGVGVGAAEKGLQQVAGVEEGGGEEVHVLLDEQQFFSVGGKNVVHLACFVC